MTASRSAIFTASCTVRTTSRFPWARHREGLTTTATSPGTRGATRPRNDRRRAQAWRFCFVSAGVPLIVAGDEMYRTQFGNNNPFNLDNDKFYLDYGLRTLFPHDFNYAKAMIAFRTAHPALRRSDFFDGNDHNGNGLKDVTWVRDNGQEADAGYLATTRTTSSPSGSTAPRLATLRPRSSSPTTASPPTSRRRSPPTSPAIGGTSSPTPPAPSRARTTSRCPCDRLAPRPTRPPPVRSLFSSSNPESARPTVPPLPLGAEAVRGAGPRGAPRKARPAALSRRDPASNERCGARGLPPAPLHPFLGLFNLKKTYIQQEF